MLERYRSPQTCVECKNPRHWPSYPPCTGAPTRAASRGPASPAMALDERTHRLFLGVRAPASMVVLNSDTGQQVAEVGRAGALDGLAFDAAIRGIYTAGGEGFLDFTQQVDADHYLQIARIPTG